MRLFYIAFESIFDPVFDSQVLEFIQALNGELEKDHESAKLLIFGSLTDIFRKKYWRKRKKITGELKGDCIFFFKVPYSYQVPVFFRLSLFINSFIALKTVFLFLRLRKSEKAVFHCRTEIASYIMLKIRDKLYPNMKVVCDCRGVGSQEIKYKYEGAKGRTLSKKILKVEKYAYKNSDMLFCVSNSFKQYILERNKVTPDIKVVPCCINTKRFEYNPALRQETRSKLGISDRFVVLYSGSFNEWQLPKKMIEIFMNLKKIIPGCIFLILTRDVETAETIFSASEIENDSYIINYVPFENISGYINCGDVSLLIREENDVNRVAFPIKFTEYVRCGVPVITSISSDIGRLIEERNLGMVIRDLDDLKEMEKIVKAIRAGMDMMISKKYKENISRIIAEEFGWDKYIPSIISTYRNLGLDE